ncbi:MAG: hypothetical protein QG599_3315 [Pseudomonadota bacterium]|nr:hypothetical protein [Pseudomonadota bacterium]
MKNWRDPSWILDDDERVEVRKALHLKGKVGTRVELDGPALRVRQPERAVQLFPVARVARVVSSGAVVWDHQALLACAAAGAPVVFLNRDGSVRGYFFGSRRRSRDRHDLLYTRLRARLTRRGGKARYAAWRERAMQAALESMRPQLPKALQRAVTADLPEALALARQRYLGSAAAELLEERLQGLLCTLSAEVFGEVGLDARRWSNLEFGLDLVGDLAELLGWTLAAPVLMALEAKFVGQRGARDLTQEAAVIGLFEQQAEALRRVGLDRLHELRQWLEG